MTDKYAKLEEQNQTLVRQVNAQRDLLDSMAGYISTLQQQMLMQAESISRVLESHKTLTQGHNHDAKPDGSEQD